MIRFWLNRFIKYQINNLYLRCIRIFVETKDDVLICIMKCSWKLEKQF